MRIWSKRLIPVLPTKQLKAMRYELGDMIKQYPNIKHPLVKFANNYDSNYLLDYFENVVNECNKRNINMNKEYNDKIMEIAFLKSNGNISLNYTFSEDNYEYFDICYYNLYEKYLRGIITEEEWQKIEDLIKSEVE